MLLPKYHILISQGQTHFELMPISWCQDDSSLPNVPIQISYLSPGGKIKDKENKSRKLRFPLVPRLQAVTPVLHFPVETLLNSRTFEAAFGLTPWMSNTCCSVSCIPQTLADKQLA